MQSKREQISYLAHNLCKKNKPNLTALEHLVNLNKYDKNKYDQNLYKEFFLLFIRQFWTQNPQRWWPVDAQNIRFGAQISKRGEKK